MSSFISAVIITYNEEANIGRCVDSLQGVADEIVVLDSFSSDKTESICRAKNVKFHQRQWEGYSATKNYANSLATGEYILSIDADEALDDDLRGSILDFKKSPRADACQINRITNYCGRWIKHGGWYPEWKIRIFKKYQASWQGVLHEGLVFTTPPTLQRLNGHLLHYSYYTIDSHLKKILLYGNLAAKRDLEKGKRYNLPFHGIVRPLFAFIRGYFLQLGFLDGYEGFIIARLSAFERFFRYLKFRERLSSTQNLDKTSNGPTA